MYYDDDSGFFSDYVIGGAKKAYRAASYGVEYTKKNTQLMKLKNDISSAKANIKKLEQCMKQLEKEMAKLTELETRKNTLENELKNLKVYSTPKKSPPKKKSPPRRTLTTPEIQALVKQLSPVLT